MCCRIPLSTVTATSMGKNQQGRKGDGEKERESVAAGSSWQCVQRGGTLRGSSFFSLESV